MRRALLALVLLLGVASYLTRPRRVEPADGPLLAGAQIPPAVLALIEKSCRDCHSDTTFYPWYSYVAPISFLIQHDVNDGREHLNLSKWSNYPPLRQQRLLSEIANQVKDGEMPMSIYTFLHRDAKLSEADVNAVFEWTQSERARLIQESSSK